VSISSIRPSAIGNLHSALLPLSFLVAFSAVYNVMLIYAPRQIAEKEGAVVEWLLRYALFVISIVLGFTWLSILAA
jgi:hypothetical protein